jgi:hypothetical protein
LITGFLAQLRECRRPLIAVAVALVALQTLLAGLATAQAAARLMASPFDAICHGAGGADPAADGAPGSGSACEMCCALCAATAPALVSVTPPVVGHFEHVWRLWMPAPQPILTVRYAVRAGPSQAPPSFA